MTLERDLAPELDRSLSHLPSVPATTYLATARRVRRRRRGITGAAAAVALVGGLVITSSLSGPPERASVASTGPSLDPDGSLREQPVSGMPALEGIDAFTTEGIPEWAQEYGNHGPAAVAPDGRLWVAPGERITRVIPNPFGDPDLPEDRTYAIEATYEGGQRWVVLPSPGLMEPPGLWTNDFELWTQNMVSSQGGGPSFSEGLVRFAGAGSEQLVPQQGVDLVRQVAGVELPSTSAQHPRSSVAEVRYRGRTWFVLAQGPARGAPFYAAYEPAVSASDLDSFVEWLEDRS